MATHAHATNRRILYLDCFVGFVGGHEGSDGWVDWTIRHLTGQTRQLGAIQMRTRRKRGAKERWTANPFK